LSDCQTQGVSASSRTKELVSAQSSAEVFKIISRAAYLTCYSGFDVLHPSNEYPLVQFLPEFGYQRELFQVGRRIHMLIDEKFDLLDGKGSNLHLDGVSRTYLATGGIFIAGVGDITESYGQVAGAVGHIGVSGYSKLPPNFSLILIFRTADPTGKLIAKSPLPPIDPAHRLKDLYPFSVLLPPMAELHPDYPVVIEPAPDGKKKQVHLVERVRLCDLSTDVSPGLIESHNAIGQVVGERRTTLVFDPDDSNKVIPLFTKNSLFRFFAEDNKTIGTLEVELSEARAFPTYSPDLQHPYFRIGGYGNFGEGTGQFKQAEGVLTATGAFSLNPGALSSLYILRINDRLHRFRPLWAYGPGRKSRGSGERWPNSSSGEVVVCSRNS
jgi:hypothetical protein